MLLIWELGYLQYAIYITNFNKIYFKCLVPPSNLTNTFGRLSNSCKLKYVAVPIGCKDAYMRAFSNYIDVIEEIEF